MNCPDIIGGKILDCVLAALGRNLDYLIHYKSNVDNLIPQVIYLLDAKDSIQNEVAAARRNVMEIHPHVQTWLTRSDGIIAEAEEFIKNNGHSKMTCCNGWCPNLISRYRVSKRAYKMRLEVEKIKEKGSFNGVGFRESTQVVETLTSNKGYEAFESRMPTITGVLEALKDPNITRIGIHGMGGVGKTMLVKEVLKHAEEGKLFDKYLFSVVSNDPDLTRIRREIAEQLDLKLEVESELVRRDQLRKRLKQENRVLIILDDIWKKLDVEALGIFSFGDDNKGCKLLLTSRFYNVVCNDMDTQKQFPVGVLSDNEAISLFEKIVGDLAKTSEIKPTMLQIVEECARLPIAITTVANALKNQKNPRIWKDFLNQLEMSSPREIAGMNEVVYKSIKMSYEFLKNSEAKSLLLLCSLHGEDYDIEVEDLLKYAVGLGLFDNMATIEGARCRVHLLVDRLKDSSLLLDGDDNGTVKMHDVIRDVVINIAADEKRMFTIRTAIELQSLSKREDAVAISLPYINNDLELPNQFECSKLELLLLSRQRVGLRMPDSFFEGLKDLKVLKLSGISWSGVLPSSLSSLENLQTLCLDGYEAQNAIIIGELKNLKALSLSLYDIKRLPKEIGQLTHLQLLDLGNCFGLNFIPPNVLSNLKMLEELYLPDGVEWEVEAQSTESINAMVSELDDLAKLTKLRICIENAKILPDTKVFKRLESYRIAIGSAWDLNETWETSRILKLKISFQSDCVYKVLFRKCETLILEKMKGVKNILYELESEGFQSLKHLKVEDNDEIQYIIKSMGVLDSVSPSLESITLWNVNNLERICYTRLPTKTFCNLRVVNVRNCRKLEFVFSSSMVGCCSHLQKMKIEDCEIMSAIVAIEREEEIEVNSDDSIMFANLHSLELRNLFKLKGFLSVVHSRVLFNGKDKFPDLEYLSLVEGDAMNETCGGPSTEFCCNLKQLTLYENGEIPNVEAPIARAGVSDFRRLKNIVPFSSTSFPNLEILKVDGCDVLISLLTPSAARTLVQLEVMEIRQCKRMTEIVANEGSEAEAGDEIAFNNLRYLFLGSLPSLTAFHLGNRTIKFPSLYQVSVGNCPKLISLLTPSTAKTLVQLKYIQISNCERMTEIVANEGSEAEEGDEIAFNNLRYLEFRYLPSLTAFHLGNRTIKFPSLVEVTVLDCPKLISLLTPSTARTLVQLRKIEIENCERMTEIVANEGSEVEVGDEIAFNNLTSLRLEKLSSLTAFHLGNRTIKFPSLDKVGVWNCPKLKIFCSGVLSMPKLTGFRMEEKWITKEEGDGDLDLNATIKEYWEAKLETCDQKFVEKTDASEVREREHDANDNLERDTTSEVGDTM